MIVAPPAIPGIGQAGGFEFILADTSGGSLENFAVEIDDFLAQANKRKELARVSTQFNDRVPEIEYVVDRDRARELGIPISDIFGALQTYLGGNYINDFNLFGRTFRVTAEAEASARTQPDSVNTLYVRTQAGDMVPLSSLVSIKPTRGPAYIERYNVFRAVTINGAPASGYSQGDAINAMESLAKALPSNLTYYWTGSVFQQKRAGSQAPYIFAMALVFVFLVLAAQYESWIVPFAVILCIPFAVFGAFLGLSMRGMANDIYAQVGLVMLIGLAAKNAILIVEFARLSHQRGMPLIEAAIEGARLRLRPILMTSFAFILGALPLAIATGAGARSREVLGTTVVFGMTGRDHDRHLHRAGVLRRPAGPRRPLLQIARPRGARARGRDGARGMKSWLCACALLAGCAVGPDYHRPSLDVPAHYRDAAPPAAAPVRPAMRLHSATAAGGRSIRTRTCRRCSRRRSRTITTSRSRWRGSTRRGRSSARSA